MVSVAVGCGGGGKDTSGRASIAIEWPEPGRLIPKAANFVRVRAFTAGGDPVGTQPASVGRPVAPASSTSTITIDNLPVGANITFRAEAFAQNPDNVAGQIPQASGQQTLLIRNDAENTFDISMASTVSAITFQRDATPIAGTLNLVAGEDANITAQARNTTGALVLVDNNNWSWNSGNADLKVNSGAAATGATVIARGQATFTAALNVMETESNIPSALNIQVVEPTYPGAVDGAIAGDATGFGDVASGPMDTKAPGDRVFALITRLDPLGKFSQREVDIHDSETLARVPSGNFVPSFAGPPAQHIVRNSTGIALSYDNQTSEATVVNFRDDGSRVWSSVGLGFLAILDLTARKGHTYVMQDGPGVGFRVSKLRDSDGAIVKEYLAPRNITPGRITVDDEESIYFLHSDGNPLIMKIDRNGDPQPFDPGNVSVNSPIDIDFDQGLIFVLDGSPSASGVAGVVYVLGQAGRLVQTIPVPELVAGENARRMSVFRGQIFVITEITRGGFQIRKVHR
jgi:hypothetical protein